jgi:hypothetical protein
MAATIGHSSGINWTELKASSVAKGDTTVNGTLLYGGLGPDSGKMRSQCMNLQQRNT